MSKQQVQVQVNQATFQVGMALAKLISDSKAAVKTGNTVAEIASITTAFVTDLVPVLSQLPGLASDASSVEDEIMTAAVVGQAIVKAILS